MDALSGCIGAAVSNVLTYPLALKVTRRQVQGPKEQRESHILSIDDQKVDKPRQQNYPLINDALDQIYSENKSSRGFWNGVGADTGKTVLDAFLFFYAYNFLRKNRLRRAGNAKQLSALNELGVGFFAGAFSKLLTTPLANVVTRKQTSSAGNTSARSISAEIYEIKGYKGFWAGYTASLILTLNPSLTFFLFETLKRLIIPRRRKEGNIDARVTFLLAATSKAIASSVTYPFSLAKARLQASSSKSQDARLNQGNVKASDKASPGSEKRLSGDNDASNTVFGTVHRILQKEGASALYDGLSGEVTKGFFSHGITMMLKDGVHSTIIHLHLLLLRLLRRNHALKPTQS